MRSEWNEEIKLHDGSYSVSDIQDYFKYILIKHQTVTDNLPTMIHVNKIGNRIAFKINTEYYLARLMPETLKSFESTKSKINEDKIGKNVTNLEIAKIVLIDCNIVNSDYQQDLKVLYTFVPNK